MQNYQLYKSFPHVSYLGLYSLTENYFEMLYGIATDFHLDNKGMNLSPPLLLSRLQCDLPSVTLKRLFLFLVLA